MPLKREYHENGFLVLRDFFSTKELLELSDLVDSIYQQWLEVNQESFEKHGLINMHSLTQPHYFTDSTDDRCRLFKAISPTKLVELLDEVFETEIHFHNTQLFFNPHNSRQLPYWHRDLQFSPIPEADQQVAQLDLLTLHVRIPLVKEVGLEVIKGSHRRWDTLLERQVRLELEGHQNIEDLPGGVVLDLDPGDLVVFNAQMIHRGRYSENDTRKALDLCVGSAHPLTNGSLDPNNLPSAEELDSLQTDLWYQRAWSVLGSRPL